MMFSKDSPISYKAFLEEQLQIARKSYAEDSFSVKSLKQQLANLENASESAKETYLAGPGGPSRE